MRYSFTYLFFLTLYLYLVRRSAIGERKLGELRHAGHVAGRRGRRASSDSSEGRTDAPRPHKSCVVFGSEQPTHFATQGLSAMWVALSPLAGRDVWEAMCAAYAYQLQQAGDVHKAVRPKLSTTLTSLTALTAHCTQYTTYRSLMVH